MTGMFWFFENYMELTIYLLSNMQPSVREVLKYNCRLIHYTQIFRFLNYIKIKSIILVSDLKSLCKQFDVVIFVPDFHVPAYCVN